MLPVPELANRKTARDTLKGLFVTALKDTGVVAEVYTGMVKDFGGKSPVIVVASGGSGRERRTHDGQLFSRFRLYVLVFVLYSDSASGWDEVDSEDRADLIEALIAEVIRDNPIIPDVWGHIEYGEEMSNVSPQVVGSLEYKVEGIEIYVEATNDAGIM